MMVELYMKDTLKTFDIYWHMQNNEIVIDTNKKLIQLYFPQETSLLTLLEGLGLGDTYVSPNIWPAEKVILDLLNEPVENQSLCILKLYESYNVMLEYSRELSPNKASQSG